VAQYAQPGSCRRGGFFLNIIPRRSSMRLPRDVLQVLLLSILFGFALHATGGRSSIVFELVDKFSRVMFSIVASS